MKNIIKRLFVLTATITFIIPTFTGCQSSTSTSEEQKQMTKITLNEVAHSIFYAPQYVAIEKGYFAEEGIDLNLVTGFGADKVMTSLISGDAQIGFCGSESSVYIYNEGYADYAVNFAQLTQRAGNFLVSREPIDNFDFNMLKGKTVLGGRAGGMPEMILEYILKQKGISKDELNIVQNIDFGATAGAFTGGNGDFTVEFEPHATLLEQQSAGYVVASLGTESGYVPYTAYCAKKSYIKENPDVIRRFNKAIQRGLDYVNTHSSSEIAAVIAPQFAETDMNTLTTIVERYRAQDSWKTNLLFDKAAYELLLDILESSGEIKTRPPYSDLVTTEY